MDTVFRQACLALARAYRVAPILEPTSPHSGFGSEPKETLEVPHWCVTDDRIRTRMLGNPVRRARPEQALGMTLWFLAASEHLDAVQFYNPNAERFSDDGATIRAPWGVRLLQGHETSPFAKAIDILRRDPSSLRAVVPVYAGDEDLGTASRDVPCLVALHLKIRDGVLDACAMLRSLNPYWVWPYDHFQLTLLLELGAVQLGLQPGRMTYFASSLQIDATDQPLVKAAAHATHVSAGEMPAMRDASWGQVANVIRLERDVRERLASSQPVTDWTDILAMDDPFWRELFVGLAYSVTVRQHGMDGAAQTGLHPPHWLPSFPE